MKLKFKKKHRSTRNKEGNKEGGSKVALTRVGLLPLLSETETFLMDNMISRIKTIADYANKKKLFFNYIYQIFYLLIIILLLLFILMY